MGAAAASKGRGAGSESRLTGSLLSFPSSIASKGEADKQTAKFKLSSIFNPSFITIFPVAT